MENPRPFRVELIKRSIKHREIVVSFTRNILTSASTEGESTGKNIKYFIAFAPALVQVRWDRFQHQSVTNFFAGTEDEEAEDECVSIRNEAWFPGGISKFKSLKSGWKCIRDFANVMLL